MMSDKDEQKEDFVEWHAVSRLKNKEPEPGAAVGAAEVSAPAAEPGDAVYANDDFITIHAMHALNGGKKRLSFRRPSKVIDMHDNTVIAECADGIELTMKIGETRWFQLLPVK